MEKIYFLPAYLLLISPVAIAQINAPVATSATGVNSSFFTTNWGAVSGAIDYRLDVATTSSFTLNSTVTLANWNFPSTPFPNPDVIVDVYNTLNAGKTITTKGGTGAIMFANSLNTKSVQATGWDNGANTKYWQVEVNTNGYDSLRLSSVQRSSQGNGPKNFKVQYSILPNIWKGIPDSIVTVANDYTTGAVNNRKLPDECSNQSSVFIRWIMTDNVAANTSNTSVINSGLNEIDDILITGKPTSTLNTYCNKTVSGTSQSVTGLTLGTTYFYRLRAQNASNTSISSNTISVTLPLSTPLPVDLINFSGTRKENKNLLRWSTASELNNKGFELQRSNDGNTYTTISFINSLAPTGNSAQLIQYTYEDYTYTGAKQYYRLRQVDIDGKNKLSNVVMIRDEEIKKLQVQLYPNPANTSINVQIDSPEKGELTFYIKDRNGLKIKQEVYKVLEGSNVISISTAELSSGIYYLQLINKAGESLSRSFVIQK